MASMICSSEASNLRAVSDTASLVRSNTERVSLMCEATMLLATVAGATIHAHISPNAPPLRLMLAIALVAVETSSASWATFVHGRGARRNRC